MRLDPNQCPVGTKGWLRLLSCADLMDGDFEWVKKPSVVLGEDRQWHSTDPSPQGNTFGGEASTPPVVFADWQSAVRDVIQRDRVDVKALREEADQLESEVLAVERMLEAELGGNKD